jgi:hypothetical protein
MGVFADVLGDLGGAWSRGVNQGYSRSLDDEMKLKAAVDQFKALNPLQQEAATKLMQSKSDLALRNALILQGQKPEPVTHAPAGSAIIKGGNVIGTVPMPESVLDRILSGKGVTGGVAPEGTQPVSPGRFDYGAGEQAMSGMIPSVKETAPDLFGRIRQGMGLPEESQVSLSIPKTGVRVAEPTQKAPQSVPDSLALDVAAGAVPAQKLQDGTMLDQATAQKIVDARGLRPKPEPNLGNVPDNVIIAVAEGVRPAIKLQDGTMLDQAGAQKILAKKQAIQGAQGEARGAAFAKSRPVTMLDTQNENRPTVISLQDALDANKSEPGRYIPTAAGVPALNKTVLLEDIRGGIQQTRGALKNLQTDFSPAQASQIAIVMRKGDPGAISAFFQSAVGQTLTPDQQDYLIQLFQLREQAMAMRSVLGAGQGSDELRAAILQTIPNPATPTRGYAAKQLDAFEAVLNRLSRGIPKVPLRNTPGTQATGGAPGWSIKRPGK